MPLFDVVAPQLFADRGGLLGRLLSLRPDLAQDQDDEHGPARDQIARASTPRLSDVPASSPVSSAISNALDDFYQRSILQPARDIPGYVHDAIHDPGYFANGVGASLGGLGPIASELPGAVKGALGALGLARSATRSEADQPLETLVSGVRDTRTAAGPSVGSVGSSGSSSLGPVQGGMLPGLGLAAALASRKSSELLAGTPQPIAPVLPEPPVPPVAPQAPWLLPHASPVAPRMGPIPPEPTPESQSTPAPPSSDDWQQALGPEWLRLQSFFRSKGGGSPGGGGGRRNSKRCKKEWSDALDECVKRSRDYNRNMLGPFPSKTPWSLNDCQRGLVSIHCGGNALDYGDEAPTDD